MDKINNHIKAEKYYREVNCKEQIEGGNTTKMLIFINVLKEY